MSLGLKVLIMIGLWLAIAWSLSGLQALDASYGTELPAWARIPGAVALLLGATGVLSCGVMLGRVGIGTLPGRDRVLPMNLVRSGPFRFTRNPMSLAAIILLIGIALWNRSTVSVGIAALVFFLLHVFVIYVEEPGLERRFGNSYLEYKRRVPRWIPRWPVPYRTNCADTTADN